MIAKQQEQWRWVKGFEGKYSVSDFGRVFSFYFWDGFSHQLSTFPQKELIGRLRQGYRRVHFYFDKVSRWFNVHLLVLEAFVNKPPFKAKGLHRNDIKIDNRLINLYWGTPKDNDNDRILNGGYSFSSEQVRKIRNLRFSVGLSCKEIASLFLTSSPNISRISRGVTYSVVK